MSDIVERLRNRSIPDQDCEDAADEIERLRSMNLRQSLDVAERFEQKDAEIERLRAALREIVEVRAPTWGVMQDIARAALEGKFPTKMICPECGQPMREDGYCNHIPF